ncbi:universal stress protein [Streptomyces triticisoli]|jgi:nucleotide-binding universal stress UspA family protein|uniref:universal stress protein n=1 Tax=Streptomyces triticisoli TaxID=2182797 RepID=UPI000DDA86DC|nr:universal stress protein [Streptomyces triticisoli]
MQPSEPQARVVVGVDGSPSSLAAVACAAREAELRKAALRVVHAFSWPTAHTALDRAVSRPLRAHLLEAADRLLEEAMVRAREAVPGVEARGAVMRGEPLTVLEAESRAAELVVVGSRGLGGFAGLLVGSTSTRLASHARCPVLVVREPADPAGPILLGVDGSPAGAEAVRFAFDEAGRRRAGLVALHAWTTWNTPLPRPVSPALPCANEPSAPAGAEERLLAEAVAGMRERYPEVRVEQRALHGPTRESLIEASRTAQLTVVGSRGRGGFAGLMLGSVSQALLHHAHGPVAVVRGRDEEDMLQFGRP